MTTKIKERYSGGDKGGNMHKGMSRKEPKGVDASMHPHGPTVDADSTRKSVAPTPRTLGPRTA